MESEKLGAMKQDLLIGMADKWGVFGFQQTSVFEVGKYVVRGGEIEKEKEEKVNNDELGREKNNWVDEKRRATERVRNE